MHEQTGYVSENADGKSLYQCKFMSVFFLVTFKHLTSVYWVLLQRATFRQTKPS